MTDTFKPVRINEYFLKQIAAGLKKEIYSTIFKPIFEVLDSKTTVYNSKIDNYNPYHDKLGRFCRAFSSQLPTLEDYKKPKKDYNLPDIPKAILEKLGKKQKPLVLKKNIIEKNKEHHPEVGIEEYNDILDSGIYKADVIFKTKENDDYYNFAHYDSEGNPQILVELADNKDNYEIVNFYKMSDKNLQRKLKQAIKRVDNEGGQFLIDIEDNTSKVGVLSNLEIDSIYIITDSQKDFNPYINNAVINSTVENFNPYHDIEGKFCTSSEAKIRTLNEAFEKVKAGSDEEIVKNVRNDLEQYGGTNDIALVKGTTKGGVTHINEKHPEDVKGIFAALVYGEITKTVPERKVFIEYNGYRAVLSLDMFGHKKTWLLTGYKIKETLVDNSEVCTQSASMQFKPTFSRQELGANVSNNIITDSRTDFNPYINNTIYNDRSTLVNAINSGRIYYNDGAFRSSKPFSNAVADELEKLGAKYRNGAYYIERSMLPLEIENTLALVAVREAAKVAALNGLLLRLADTLRQDTAVKLFIEKATERMFKKLQTDLYASTAIKQVPVIDVSVDIPEINISDNIYGELDEFHPFDENYDRTTGKKNKKSKGKGKGKGKEGNKGGGSSDSGNGNNPPVGPNSSGVDTPPADDNGNAPKDDKGAEETPKPKQPKINLDGVVIDKRAKKISEDYTYNMDYWVKNWKAKEIVKMRRTVLHMTQNGARTETIKKYFMNRWGIAERKAEFLARNESGIASSVLKATHYQDMGCTHFMWLKSTSREKRPLHEEYAKKTGNQYGIGGTNIFSFSDPPVIEQVKAGESYIPKTGGQKGLPGQTYNCSCNLVGIKNPQYYINRKKIENAKRNIFTKIKYAIENSMQRNNNSWRYRRFGEGQEV